MENDVFVQLQDVALKNTQTLARCVCVCVCVCGYFFWYISFLSQKGNAS